MFMRTVIRRGIPINYCHSTRKVAVVLSFDEVQTVIRRGKKGELLSSDEPCNGFHKKGTVIRRGLLLSSDELSPQSICSLSPLTEYV